MTFGTNVVRLSASRTCRIYPPGVFLVIFFTRGWVDPRAMVRSEENMSLKNPVTPPGIDPGTVRLVAQCLNHYATPLLFYIGMKFCLWKGGKDTGWVCEGMVLRYIFGPRRDEVTEGRSTLQSKGASWLALLIKHYSGNQIKKNEIRGHVARMVKSSGPYSVMVGKSEKKDNVEDQSIGGRTIFK